jgi:hypothetical protein
MAKGKHPVTFRTRKLSSSAPMVLHRGRCGRVGHRRTIVTVKGHPSGWPFLRSRPVGGGLFRVHHPFSPLPGWSPESALSAFTPRFPRCPAVASGLPLLLLRAPPFSRCPGVASGLPFPRSPPISRVRSGSAGRRGSRRVVGAFFRCRGWLFVHPGPVSRLPSARPDRLRPPSRQAGPDHFKRGLLARSGPFPPHPVSPGRPDQARVPGAASPGVRAVFAVRRGPSFFIAAGKVSHSTRAARFPGRWVAAGVCLGAFPRTRPRPVRPGLFAAVPLPEPPSGQRLKSLQRTTPENSYPRTAWSLFMSRSSCGACTGGRSSRTFPSLCVPAS